jgi:protein phosphatase
MNAWSKIDIGPVRDNQEDALYNGDRLFVISDGMGGHAAGELASQAVIDAFAALDEDTVDLDVMIQAVRDANQANIDGAGSDPYGKGRGSTCVAVYIEDDVCMWVHVGDSRIYHHSYRNSIVQVTKDHGYRNFLNNFVGYDQMTVDSGQFDLKSGDSIMLCSDGVSDVLLSQEIAFILDKSKDPANDLVARAIQNNTRDNCAAIVISI